MRRGKKPQKNKQPGKGKDPVENKDSGSEEEFERQTQADAELVPPATYRRWGGACTIAASPLRPITLRAGAAPSSAGPVPLGADGSGCRGSGARVGGCCCRCCHEGPAASGLSAPPA